jgi:hypothetical protein
MSIVRPKPLLALMREHWSFVQRLALAATQDSAMFDAADLERAAALEMADRSPAERQAVLADMQAKGLLQEFPRTRDLQLNPAVQAFAQSMMHEHQLGLVGVVKANVEAIQEATDEINRAVAASQFTPTVKQAAMKLQMLCRNIRAQVDNNHDAILNLADAAKAADANLPVGIRYQQVLEAFDTYIDPMIEMIRPGESGQFDRYVLAAENTLDAADAAIARTGGLATLRRDVHAISLMLKDLPSHTREQMMHAVAVLMPMREQIRKHSAMSVAVTRLLSAVRKRGLSEALPSDLLPDFSRIKPTLVQLGLPSLKMIAEIRNYAPAVATFPEMGEVPEAVYIDATTLLMVEARLREVGPETVLDLLAWTESEFPGLDDLRCLGLYHALLASQQWRSVAEPERTTLALSTVDVEYRPHRVEPLPKEAA